MKKIIVLFLMLVLSGSVAHAGIFDWITGKATGEEKPDLVITDLTWSEPVVALQSFAATITVKNIGTAPKPEGDIVFAVSTPLTTSRCIHNGIVGILAPGDFITKTFTFTCSELEKNNYGFPEGNYEITAVIDYDKALDELDETNNAFTKTLVVGTAKTLVSEVKEQVKCTFLDSSSEQKCYTSDGKFACSGIGSCAIGVSGQQGQQLHWKNSCGSEAYTKIDGVDDSLEFKCEPIAIPPPTSTETVAVPAGAVYEEVTCDFAYSNAIQQCYSEDKKFSCTGKDRCLAKIYGKKGERIIFKGTCKEGYSEILIDGVYNNVWFNCKQAQTQTPTPTSIPAETFKEQVKCMFLNSETLQNPHTSKEKCYTDDERFGCVWTGNVAEEQISGKSAKYSYCIADVSGTQGEKLTWKSSCGGYAYTVIDGSNENAEFKCLPAKDVTAEQIKGHGFKHAYWQCYDGTEQKQAVSASVSCQSSETWQEKAKEFCKDHCYKDGSKCGVNTFSVSGECYFASEAERKKEEIKMREEAGQRMMASVLIYSYLGDCPECAELEALSVNKMPLKTEDRAKTTDFRYANFNYKQFLDKYQNENVLLYLDIMAEIKEGEAKAYAKVYERPGKIDFKTAEEWWRNQVLTKAIKPVYDTLSDKVITAPEIKTDFLVYYYSGDCPECEKLKNIQADIGDKKVVVGTESSGKTSMSLAIVAALKSFLEKHKDENYLIYGMYSGDNDLSLYAKAGKADYWETGEWIRQIRAGKLSPTGVVGKTEEEIKKQLGQQTEKQKPAEEVIICKDSCPLNGKCYPFGYRKGGEYCSDEGAFKEQLKADAVCDNNFECSTNVCIDGKCISSGLIQKIVKWLKNLLPGGKEAKENAKSVDCGTSSECMEDAFKACKPAKMSQSQGGPISEIAIVGLEGKKCVLKWTAGNESMTCKFENYALGMKDMGSGSMEQYCEGPLTYRLASAPKMARAPVFNSVMVATKLSADPNDLRYSFTAQDPDGVSEFSIVKSNFGEVAVKVEPPCAKEFTTELKFNPSDLPLSASVIDCGTQVTRQELKVDIQIPISPASAPKTKPSTEIQPQKTEQIKKENIQEPISAQQKTPAPEQVSTTPSSSKLSKEQVRCKFIDPELVQRCYADFGKLGCQDIKRKCYTDDGKFECSDITVASTPLGSGFMYVPFCIAEVYGEPGTKLAWKSNCEGYGYTIIDRSNEDVTFMCMPLGSQIKGFLHAYWKCGNGVEEKSIEGVDLTTCKSSEIWKEYAKESCKNQGGIKDFSVSGECSIAVQKEGVFIST